MRVNGKLMDFLTGYAASHQHPLNIFVHMIGIPTIMLGVLIPLTWVGVDIAGYAFNLAHVAMIGFFLFYLTLDKLFATVFLVFALIVAQLAGYIGEQPMATAGTIAAVAFFGGYAAQFIGHAVEKSMPVLVKHPIQANLAAPFFTVVEMFKILGLRDDLFNEVQRQIESQRKIETT
ncbi:MAG: DUF962 domain-containing protein [Gammaproteobacteria bacterium]|nr:DUF962 domain-containing protein [Gammaproteobacteria bacterium]